MLPAVRCLIQDVTTATTIFGIPVTKGRMDDRRFYEGIQLHRIGHSDFAGSVCFDVSRKIS